MEEFFFRVLLQTRLSAVLKSKLGGIVLASLIFGLARAPGLYLRTAITQEGLPPQTFGRTPAARAIVAAEWRRS